jgi:hypothetical protein
MDSYTRNGYKSRRDYLTQLAEDYGVDIATVLTLAALLGPIEDFDGLVTHIAEIAGSM